MAALQLLFLPLAMGAPRASASSGLAFSAGFTDDAGRIAAELSEIELAPDLLEHLHRESAGSTRLVCVGLARIEQIARARGLGKISLSEWGKRPLFTGDAPGTNSQGLRAVR